MVLADYLQRCERHYILEALEKRGWQIGETALALGISRKSLWERMRRLRITSGRRRARVTGVRRSLWLTAPPRPTEGVDNGRHFNIIRNMQTTEVIKALAALAQETRLAIFRMLVQAGPGRLAGRGDRRAPGSCGPRGVVSPRAALPRGARTLALAGALRHLLGRFRTDGRPGRVPHRELLRRGVLHAGVSTYLERERSPT